MEVRDVLRWRLAVALATFLVAVASLALAGCGSDLPEDAEIAAEAELAGRFELPDGLGVAVVTDRQTGCQYLCYAQGWGSSRVGGITLLVDEYGYPLLAEGHERGPKVGMSQDWGE